MVQKCKRCVKAKDKLGVPRAKDKPGVYREVPKVIPVVLFALQLHLVCTNLDCVLPVHNLTTHPNTSDGPTAEGHSACRTEL